jgi:P pilus assembly chaperone PapD
MRFRLSAILLFVLLAGCATMTKARPPADGVWVPERAARYHFGRVEQGETVRVKFVLHNPAPYRIVIDRVENTCGCTTTNLEGDALLPEQAKTLWVELDTSRLWGPQSKTVIVHTNDPYRQEVKLVLEGTVHVPVTVQPRRVREVRAGETFAATATFTNDTDGPLTIAALGVDPESPHVTASFVGATPPFSLAPGEAATVRLDAQLTRPGARLVGNVWLDVDGAPARPLWPFYLERPAKKSPNSPLSPR